MPKQAGDGSAITKKCNRCHKVKEVREFYHDRSRSDGLSTRCKECEAECGKRRRERLKNRTAAQLPDIKSKQCSKCGRTKPVVSFYRDQRSLDGYSSCCRLCDKKRRECYYKKLTARARKSIPPIEHKRCPVCGQEKPVSHFYKAAAKPDGYRTLCKECERRHAAEYANRIADRDFDDIATTGKKQCTFCHKKLPMDQFNYCRSSPDGLASYCRKCGRDYKQKHYREHQTAYYEATAERRRKHPERERAYRIVQEALNRGEIIRPDKCSKCGKTGEIVAHHDDDYSKPLEIVWLCLSCDRQLHAELRRNEE